MQHDTLCLKVAPSLPAVASMVNLRFLHNGMLQAIEMDGIELECPSDILELFDVNYTFSCHTCKKVVIRPDMSI